MAMISNNAATPSSKNLVTIRIRIRIQSVHAVTEDYDPQHPPKHIHSMLRRHQVHSRGHPFRVPGLRPEQLPPTIVVAFTTARDTLVSSVFLNAFRRDTSFLSILLHAIPKPERVYNSQVVFLL